jgi:hypothetical protein
MNQYEESMFSIRGGDGGVMTQLEGAVSMGSSHPYWLGGPLTCREHDPGGA